ncbi:hypothetical protein CEUSTIGMA_g12067.t1 [Chlamydomonas eustigma]|uniref:Uncharacterized protein n=1 Tax=Chlamydomonas eustigma TaxID=1157962 RepID=A0A250XNQ4_9CHLO|nr:hypothetical protein CEUSTIGMA_g12067.t1 [Chlamydomonas eustigma]|eukprot:GAX84646.1 hypothetical protein CEUSTIGMA_g12067.t1 [Chlamydomonas eustigma]
MNLSSLHNVTKLRAFAAGRNHCVILPIVRRAAGMATQATPTVPEVYTTSEDPEVLAFQQHQKTAARPSPAEDARTMMGLARFGVLSTVSVREDARGLPLGSVVEFAVDGSGSPIFAVSSLSSHTRDLKEDGRASLTVMAPGFQGVKDSRFTLQGRVRQVEDEDKGPLRQAFLTKYPDAFWVDFQDFKWFIMDEIAVGRYNGGFAMAKKLTPEEYSSARMDPVSPFSVPVCSHMNFDHKDDMKAMIRHYVGMQVEDVTMLDLDRLGINFDVKFKDQAFKLRLPYPQPVEDRKAIKEAIVTMTRAAASTASAGSSNA